jgi:hypothetical protein
LASRRYFSPALQVSLAAYRTQLKDANGMGNVKRIQSGYKVQTLSAYLEQPAPPPAPGIDFSAINKELVKTNFLNISTSSFSSFRPRRKKRTSAQSWRAPVSEPGTT